LKEQVTASTKTGNVGMPRRRQVSRLCRKFAFSRALGAVSHWIADTRFADFAPKSKICDRPPYMARAVTWWMRRFQRRRPNSTPLRPLRTLHPGSRFHGVSMLPWGYQPRGVIAPRHQDSMSCDSRRSVPLSRRTRRILRQFVAGPTRRRIQSLLGAWSPPGPRDSHGHPF
jgi:hypothetical protein